MAEEKVEKTAAAVLPLSVSVPVEEEKMKKQQARADPPLLPGVRDAILWSLLHAGVFPLALAVGTAYYMLIITIFTHPVRSVPSTLVDTNPTSNRSHAPTIPTCYYYSCCCSRRGCCRAR